MRAVRFACGYRVAPLWRFGRDATSLSYRLSLRAPIRCKAVQDQGWGTLARAHTCIVVLLVVGTVWAVDPSWFIVRVMADSGKRFS